jgi:hypothetical protein
MLQLGNYIFIKIFIGLPCRTCKYETNRHAMFEELMAMHEISHLGLYATMALR